MSFKSKDDKRPAYLNDTQTILKNTRPKQKEEKEAEKNLNGYVSIGV
jgi:hypothetical protein